MNSFEKRKIFFLSFILLISFSLIFVLNSKNSFAGSNDEWKSCCASGCDYTWGQTKTMGGTTYICCYIEGGWTTSKSCSDSDSGQDFTTQGTVKDCSGSYTDYCSGNTLTEYYCSNNDHASTTKNCNDYDCTSGISCSIDSSNPSKLIKEGDDYSCSNGECSKTGTKTCQTWTCDSSMEGNSVSCGGTTYYCCYVNGNYQWQTSPCGGGGAQCSGSISLSLSPNPAQPSSTITASTSGLSNCDGKTIYIKDYQGCSSGTTICSCTSGDSGCSCQFTAPSSEGDYTYFACIDKNGDDDFSDSGESDSVVLTVQVSCVDECSSGQVQYRCSGNELQKRTCGNYDQDPCLEWSSWQDYINCTTNSPYSSGNTCYYNSHCVDYGNGNANCEYDSDSNKPSSYYSSGNTCYYNCTVECTNNGWKRSDCNSDTYKFCSDSKCTNLGWDNSMCSNETKVWVEPTSAFPGQEVKVYVNISYYDFGTKNWFDSNKDLLLNLTFVSPSGTVITWTRCDMYNRSWKKFYNDICSNNWKNIESCSDSKHHLEFHKGYAYAEFICKLPRELTGGAWILQVTPIVHSSFYVLKSATAKIVIISRFNIIDLIVNFFKSITGKFFLIFK